MANRFNFTIVTTLFLAVLSGAGCKTRGTSAVADADGDPTRKMLLELASTLDRSLAQAIVVKRQTTPPDPSLIIVPFIAPEAAETPVVQGPAIRDADLVWVPTDPDFAMIALAVQLERLGQAAPEFLRAGDPAHEAFGQSLLALTPAQDRIMADLNLPNTQRENFALAEGETKQDLDDIVNKLAKARDDTQALIKKGERKTARAAIKKQCDDLNIKFEEKIRERDAVANELSELQDTLTRSKPNIDYLERAREIRDSDGDRKYGTVKVQVNGVTRVRTITEAIRIVKDASDVANARIPRVRQRLANLNRQASDLEAEIKALEASAPQE